MFDPGPPLIITSLSSQEHFAGMQLRCTIWRFSRFRIPDSIRSGPGWRDMSSPRRAARSVGYSS
jgi:hypothetical protein